MFGPRGKGWGLLVADDGDGKRGGSPKGRGKTAEAEPKGGLGASLMAAFAQQAHAQLRTEITEQGYCAELIGRQTA